MKPRIAICNNDYQAIYATIQASVQKLPCSASLKDEIAWVVMDNLMAKCFAVNQQRKEKV